MLRSQEIVQLAPCNRKEPPAKTAPRRVILKTLNGSRHRFEHLLRYICRIRLLKAPLATKPIDQARIYANEIFPSLFVLTIPKLEQQTRVRERSSVHNLGFSSSLMKRIVKTNIFWSGSFLKAVFAASFKPLQNFATPTSFPTGELRTFTMSLPRNACPAPRGIAMSLHSDHFPVDVSCPFSYFVQQHRL